MANYGFALKMDRAKYHFDTFTSEAERFLKLNNNASSIEVNLNQVERSTKFRILVKPPPELSIYIGDCLYNLRSALDHLIWELSKGKGNTRTEFPIFREQSKFAELRRNGRPAPTSGLFKIECLPTTIQTEIERMQPYDRSDRVTYLPLWWLHELSNMDKHQMLVTSCAAPEQARFEFRKGIKVGQGELLQTVVAPFGPIYDGAELNQFDTFERLMAKSDRGVNMDGVFKMKIAFDQSTAFRGKFVEDVLGEINFVIAQRIYPTLKGFL